MDSAPEPKDTPIEADFFALARSSPKAWSSLCFTIRYDTVAPIRAWIVRPDRLRVESHIGELLRREHPDSRPEQPRALPPRVRRGRWSTGPYAARADDTVPVYQDYRWVALLEPLELADSWRDPDDPHAGEPPLTVHEVTRHSHHGRSALRAIVSTRPSYTPRCPCCPLLPSADALVADGWSPEAAAEADAPTRFLVVLDEGTGVCVGITALDGREVGTGFDAAIEEVNEPYDDAFFTGPRRHRRGWWSPRH